MAQSQFPPRVTPLSPHFKMTFTGFEGEGGTRGGSSAHSTIEFLPKKIPYNFNFAATDFDERDSSSTRRYSRYAWLWYRTFALVTTFLVTLGKNPSTSGGEIMNSPTGSRH